MNLSQKLLPLALSLVVSASAMTHANESAQTQFSWQQQSLHLFTDEQFDNAELVKRLIAKHFKNGDIYDEYWLAETYVKDLVKQPKLDEITDLLARRAYLREYALPGLDAWIATNSIDLTLPQYILLDMPADALVINTEGEQSDWSVGYLLDNNNGHKHEWSGDGFTLTTGSTKARQGVLAYTLCTSAFDIQLASSDTIEYEVATDYPIGLRAELSKTNRQSTCMYPLSLIDNGSSLTLSNANPQDFILSWIVKLDASSTSSKLKIRPTGAINGSAISVSLNAQVQGISLRTKRAVNNEDMMLWSANTGALSIATAATVKSDSQDLMKKEARYSALCEVDILDEGSFMRGQYFIGTQIIDAPADYIFGRLQSLLPILGYQDLLYSEDAAQLKATRLINEDESHNFLLTYDSPRLTLEYTTPPMVNVSVDEIESSYCDLISTL